MKPGCPCPSPEELERLLSGRDVAGEETTIIRHIGECPGCQEQLEKLAVCDSSLCELVEHMDESRPDSKSAYWPAFQSIKDFSAADERTERVTRDGPAFHATGVELGVLDSDPSAATFV